MSDLRAVRDPGPVHPRHAAAPADPLRQAGAGARAGDAAGGDRRADRDPGVRGPARARWSPASWPDVAKKFATPRRTVLLESGGGRRPPRAARGGRRPVPGAAVLGRALARVPLRPRHPDRRRCPRPTSSRRRVGGRTGAVLGADYRPRATIGAVTSAGRHDPGRACSRSRRLPAGGRRAVSLAGRRAVDEFVPGRAEGETVVGAGRARRWRVGAGLALGTAQGVVKRVAAGLPGQPGRVRADHAQGRRQGGRRGLPGRRSALESTDLAFVTSDAQLLRFPAAAVRPQGRPAGGVAGVRLTTGASVLWFGAVGPDAAQPGIGASADAEPFW